MFAVLSPPTRSTKHNHSQMHAYTQRYIACKLTRTQAHVYCCFIHPISIEMKYLPVHYPTDAEKKDASLYANNVRDELAKELG